MSALTARLVSPATALVLGGVALALMIADVPLAGLAHQSLDASGGSLPVWVSAPFAVVGFVVAWRKPGNPLGWIILGAAVFLVLSEDASFYTVADYRLRHGGLPLGWVALLAQPGWAPGIVLFGLVVLLFPDGRPPSPRLRWMVWVFAAVALLWIGGAVTITVGAIRGHHTQVDSGGNLLLLDSTSRPCRRRGGTWCPERVLRAAGGLLAGVAGSPGAQLPALVGGTPPAAEVADGRISGCPGQLPDRIHHPGRRGKSVSLPWPGSSRSR